MIIVTGASGLVGSQICKYLRAEGLPFKGMIRENSQSDLLKDIPSEHLSYSDILDPYALDELFAGATTVIHSAAVISFRESEEEWMRKTNVEGTANVVNACLRNNVGHLIHISSISALGINKGDSIITEEAPWPGTQPPSRYGKSKYAAELEVWRGTAEGLGTTVLVPSTVLGPGDWKRSSSQLFKYVWDEKKFYTTGLFNYIDVRDLAETVVSFIKTGPDNQKYIVNAGNVPYKDFFERIARSIEKKPPYIKATKFLIWIAVFLEWLKSIFTGSAPLVTAETAQRGKTEVLYQNQKLVSKTGLQFRSLDDSIEWVCGFLKVDHKK